MKRSLVFPGSFFVFWSLMTKRDVAVWFCKVIAIAGMANAVANSIGSFGSYLSFRSWVFVFYPLAPLVLYLFVFLLAGSIGTEIAAEGEHGEPITSSAGLRPLLLRCVGLGLLLSSSIGLAMTTFNFGTYYFTSSPNSFVLSTIMPRLAYQGVAQLVASAIGFILAFGPRIRAAMQPKSLSQ
jgi:hypothetical protein